MGHGEGAFGSAAPSDDEPAARAAKDHSRLGHEPAGGGPAAAAGGGPVAPQERVRKPTVTKRSSFTPIGFRYTPMVSPGMDWLEFQRSGGSYSEFQQYKIQAAAAQPAAPADEAAPTDEAAAAAAPGEDASGSVASSADEPARAGKRQRTLEEPEVDAPAAAAGAAGTARI